MARPGRPTAVIELSDSERETLQRLDRTTFFGAGGGVAIPDRAGLRRREDQR
jgi:hypothetical protein